MRTDRTSILLIIAPDMYSAAKTIEANGLDIQMMTYMRVVTKAYHLRGWSAGTPFITGFRETWGATAEGRKMEDVLSILTLRHHLRPANDRDLEHLLLPVWEAAE